MTSHIRALWHNNPRSRRHLAKSALDWHALYDLLLNITSHVRPNVGCALVPTLPRLFQHLQKHDRLDVIPLLPNVALACRLTLIRDVVFSGFQLELYTAEEKIFAYWYATQVLETHLSCLDSMIAVVPHGETICHHFTIRITQISLQLKIRQLIRKCNFSSTS